MANIFLALAGLGALGLSLAAATTDRFPGDLAAALWVQRFAAPLLDHIAETLAEAGRTVPSLFILLAISLGLALRRLRREGLWLLSTVTAVYLLALAIKAVVARPRPAHADLRILFDETTLSFPSGHALYEVALCGGLLYLASVHMRPSLQKRLLQAFLVSLPVAMGVSRVYLGVHWPSDILGSFVIGGFLVGLSALLFLPRGRTFDARRIRGKPKRSVG